MPLANRFGNPPGGSDINPLLLTSSEWFIDGVAVTASADALNATFAFTTLTSAHIIVGNGSNVPTSVAMTGDIAINNTGVTAIGANKVTLATLATGITPSHVIKFGAAVANGGGSASIVLSVAGVLSTDLVFAQLADSTNAVTVQKVTPTTDTITILLSGDPGASTTIMYQVLRAAA